MWPWTAQQWCWKETKLKSSIGLEPWLGSTWSSRTDGSDRKTLLQVRTTHCRPEANTALCASLTAFLLPRRPGDSLRSDLRSILGDMRRSDTDTLLVRERRLGDGKKTLSSRDELFSREAVFLGDCGDDIGCLWPGKQKHGCSLIITETTFN